jgi:hypothetical protein
MRSVYIGAGLPYNAFGYPRINTDGTVEFSYIAPNASSVSVFTDAGSLRLNSQGDGRWTGPQTLAPDIYRYVFLVDGIAALDPDNLKLVSGYGFPFSQSYFEVPGDGSLAFQFREQVTYGDVRRVNYYSPVLKRMRQVHICTPYEYDVKQGTGRRARWQHHPVLYLLGAAGESDSQWSSFGRAGVIIQNLIEEDKVKPMIVVMPNSRIDEPGQVNPADVDIGDELLQAVIPYVDQHYRTRTAPRSRALAVL